jgi:hypothetical protein
VDPEYVTRKDAENSFCDKERDCAGQYITTFRAKVLAGEYDTKIHDKTFARRLIELKKFGANFIRDISTGGGIIYCKGEIERTTSRGSQYITEQKFHDMHVDNLLQRHRQFQTVVNRWLSEMSPEDQRQMDELGLISEALQSKKLKHTN